MGEVGGYWEGVRGLEGVLGGSWSVYGAAGGVLGVIVDV